MEVVLTIAGVILAPFFAGFAYGMVMLAGYDPLGVGGVRDE